MGGSGCASAATSTNSCAIRAASGENQTPDTEAKPRRAKGVFTRWLGPGRNEGHDTLTGFYFQSDNLPARPLSRRLAGLVARRTRPLRYRLGHAGPRGGARSLANRPHIFSLLEQHMTAC